MTKACARCGERERTTSCYCASCRREISHDWYVANRERAAKKSTEWKEKNPGKLSKYSKNHRDKKRSILSKIKADSGCFVCGVSIPEVLDFHHAGGKSFNIGEAVSRRSIESLLEEVEKCVVVCANCHRMIHSGLIDDPTIKKD